MRHLRYRCTSAQMPKFKDIGQIKTYCCLYRRILGPVYDNEKENWRIKKSMRYKTHYNRDNKVK